jgi:hypothetical protein
MKEAAGETEQISIQVIERMVSLLDALAEYPDPVSLKELSAATDLHPSTAHRILNDLVVKRFVDRVEPAPIAWACACWSWATSSRAGCRCAKRRWTSCGRCTQDAPDDQPVGAAGR